MTPVEQTILGPQGNCFSACVASILELSIEEVPDFDDSAGWRHWFSEWQRWLAGRNLSIHCARHDERYPRPLGYAILQARWPDDGGYHHVVCFDGEIVWDPSPLREMGVGEWEYFYVFTVIDPAKGVRQS